MGTQITRPVDGVNWVRKQRTVKPDMRPSPLSESYAFVVASLEDEARERLERRAADVEARSQSVGADAVPRLDELIELLRKYDVATVGFYDLAEELPPGRKRGRKVSRYAVRERGWVVYSTDEGRGGRYISDVRLAITEEGIPYTGVRHSRMLSSVAADVVGIAPRDLILGETLMLGGLFGHSGRLTASDAARPGWENVIAAAAEKIIEGARGPIEVPLIL